jgi:excisionase family DNA binding protein
MQTEKMIFTVAEAMKYLGLSRNSIYSGIKSGQIPHIRVGKRILISRVALERKLSDANTNKID